MIFTSSLCYHLVGLSILPNCVRLPAPLLIGCRHFSCASLSLSFTLPIYPSASLFSGYRLWSTSLPLLLPLGLADSSGLGRVMLVFGGPLPPSPLRYYSSADSALLPVASAGFCIPLLPSYFPSFDLSSTLCLLLVTPSYIISSFVSLSFLRRWRNAPPTLCCLWRWCLLASCLSSAFL